MSEDDKPHTGPIEPGGAGNWGAPVPFEQAIQDILALRREWAARPEEIEARAIIAQGEAERLLARKRARGQDVIYGPLDPRKGRVRMTK